MKITAHTPQGKFEGKEHPYTEDQYLQNTHLMSNIGNLVYFTFETETGDVLATYSSISGFKETFVEK